MREAGTIRERIFQSLIKRYQADGEEALVKIDALLRGDVCSRALCTDGRHR